MYLYSKIMIIKSKRGRNEKERKTTIFFCNPPQIQPSPHSVNGHTASAFTRYLDTEAQIDSSGRILVLVLASNEGKNGLRKLVKVNVAGSVRVDLFKEGGEFFFRHRWVVSCFVRRGEERRGIFSWRSSSKYLSSCTSMTPSPFLSYQTI
jgi:hypothetical protein